MMTNKTNMAEDPVYNSSLSKISQHYLFFGKDGKLEFLSMYIPVHVKYNCTWYYRRCDDPTTALVFTETRRSQPVVRTWCVSPVPGTITELPGTGRITVNTSHQSSNIRLRTKGTRYKMTANNRNIITGY